MAYVYRKFMVRYGIKGYNILLRGNIQSPKNNTNQTKGKGITDKFKMPNKTAYKNLYYPNKTRYVSILLKNQRQNKHNMQTQEQHGRNSQVDLIQPQGFLRKYYERNLQIMNYMT